MTRNRSLTNAAAAVLCLTLMAGCGKEKPKSGEVQDEAKKAGRTPESLPGAADDYLHDMDYGLTNDPEAVRAALDPYVPGISAADAVAAVARGRNNWNIWTAGNDVLWDGFAKQGIMDLVKTVSNHPELQFDRDSRWQWLGLVNEPCFTKGTGPRADRYGLWLDERDPSCPPDPFEDAEKYPGVAYGARGKNIPLGSYYGYASGVLGLRLLPNPEFDEAAEKAWDPVRFYEDPDYYNSKNLIRPYRVGMSCGFCHIGPNPSNPPENPEEPTYANLNSNPGAQYFWIDRIFFWQAKNPKFKTSENFVYQLLHTSRPGALDTSLVSSDQINNPRTMNAVYNVGARIEIASKWGKEELSGGELDNKQFPATGPLAKYYQEPWVWTPRVLKDGADSVGVLGALNRVYINIGLFSEEWLLHFIPLVGGADVSPFPIAAAEKNSSYWVANTNQTLDTALFFLATAKPDKLAAAPGGEAHLTTDAAKLARGKVVFAETCARCHSSKLPAKAFSDFFPDNGCVNSNYLNCWNDYWQWTKTEEFKAEMRTLAEADDFLDGNYLSTELRIPVTLLETNACSPLATNALKGNTWDNFSSTSYKNLPAVGKIQVHHPITGAVSEYDMPGGGRGYTRPASLTSLWSTAPYLLNNTVGEFQWTGSVNDRVASFNDGITKMLWPEKRLGERKYSTKSGKEIPGVIDRLPENSFVRLYAGFLPDFLQPLVGFGSRWLPWLFGDGGVEIGPVPQGTPINLVSNIDLTSSKVELLRLLIKIKRDLKKLPKDATAEQASEVLKNLVEPLLNVSKCKDFIVNRGHYFGTDVLPESEGETPLSDDDKYALIEFLKTL